jgi:hypothetical protein
MMWQWKQRQERRRRQRTALQLLTVGGAVRPVDTVVRYRGKERVLGTWVNDNSSTGDDQSNRPSIWNTEIKDLWKRSRDNGQRDTARFH